MKRVTWGVTCPSPKWRKREFKPPQFKIKHSLRSSSLHLYQPNSLRHHSTLEAVHHPTVRTTPPPPQSTPQSQVQIRSSIPISIRGSYQAHYLFPLSTQTSSRLTV